MQSVELRDCFYGIEFTNMNTGEEMSFKDFFRSTFKVAISIFLAVIALSLVGLAVWKINDHWTKQEAKQYEVIKDWPVDLKENLKITLLARTKLVDGRLLSEINIDGYPAYLSDPRLQAKNRTAGITLLFQDKDGFKVHSKAIQMPEFSSIVDANGKKSGLRHEFDDYMSSETYSRFARLRIEWSLDTELPLSPSPVPSSDSQIADHCAPNLSKAERLKRLTQHGSLRETGNGEYSAGDRSVLFNSYDGALIYCR